MTTMDREMGPVSPEARGLNDSKATARIEINAM